MAVAVGFEPTDGLPRHTLSRRAPSAARTRHRGAGYRSLAAAAKSGCATSTWMCAMAHHAARGAAAGAPVAETCAMAPKRQRVGRAAASGRLSPRAGRRRSRGAAESTLPPVPRRPPRRGGSPAGRATMSHTEPARPQLGVPRAEHHSRDPGQHRAPPRTSGTAPGSPPACSRPAASDPSRRGGGAERDDLRVRGGVPARHLAQVPALADDLPGRRHHDGPDRHVARSPAAAAARVERPTHPRGIPAGSAAVRGWGTR